MFSIEHHRIKFSFSRLVLYHIFAALPPSLAQVNAVEALMVLRQLVQDHALLPSSLQRPVAQLESGAAGAGAGGGAFVPGAGAAYLTPGKLFV